MSKITKFLAVVITSASFAAPINANAALGSVSCSVAIDYSLNNVLIEPYQSDFVAELGVEFLDDFSTVTRFKEFSALTAREGNNIVVSIYYFNDIGVFDALDLSTKLTLHKKGVPESTSGSNTFSTSQGTAGNHKTNYTLTCTRL